MSTGTVSAERADFLSRGVPTSARGIVERAFAGTASPRAAIKAKCLDCCCYDRAEVAECTVTRCPIHAYRPFQKQARKPSKTARGGDLFVTIGAAGTPDGAA